MLEQTHPGLPRVAELDRVLATPLPVGNGRRRNYGPADGNDGSLGRISGGIGASQHFLLDVLHELLDLPLHFFHTLAHLQDDRHASDVHPKVASEREDEFQPFQVFIRIESCVALGARRLK